jgi:hypothetical protein
MSLYEFMIIWYLIGLLTTITGLYICWYKGEHIPVQVLFVFRYFLSLDQLLLFGH